MRETTAREMKHYYLQCLHQLVNGKSNTNGLHGELFRQPALGLSYQPPVMVQPPTCSSQAENLRPRYHEECQSDGIIHSSTVTPSTQVLRTQDTNSHSQIPTERRHRRGVVTGEKRKSAMSSPNRKSTSSSSSPSKIHLSGAHHYRTNASSSQKAVVGRSSKKLNDAIASKHPQRVLVKGGVHGSSTHSGHGACTTAGSAVKKDLFGWSSNGKRATMSTGLVHSSCGGGSVKEAKSVTGGKLNKR